MKLLITNNLKKIPLKFFENSLLSLWFFEAFWLVIKFLKRLYLSVKKLQILLLLKALSL